MRVFVIAIFAVMILCGCSQQSQQQEPVVSQQAPSTSQVQNSNELVMVVHGLSCPLCATNLRKKVMEIDGVKAVFPDLDSGDVGVRYEEGKKPTNEQLEKAVKESGFTLVEIKG